VRDRPRAVFEDPDLPHQIVIAMRGPNFGIMVSCNCMRSAARGGPIEPIEIRARWTAAEAIAVWQAHHAEAGNAA